MVEFEILLTQSHTLDLTPNEHVKSNNHDRLGWPNDPDGSNCPTQTG